MDAVSTIQITLVSLLALERVVDKIFGNKNGNTPVTKSMLKSHWFELREETRKEREKEIKKAQEEQARDCLAKSRQNDIVIEGIQIALDDSGKFIAQKVETMIAIVDDMKKENKEYKNEQKKETDHLKTIIMNHEKMFVSVNNEISHIKEKIKSC